MFCLVEDGVLRFKQDSSPEDLAVMEEIGNSGNIFTLGCMYWNRVNKYMTMQGSVTDAQIFSRNLRDEEMIAYTKCSQKVMGSHQKENFGHRPKRGGD